MIRQYELVDRVKAYDTSANEDALNRAYVFSMMAHGSQKRASGDPYISHPLEVAGILTELKLDSDTIVTGLLHDTVEDTVATIEEIQTQFGDSVAHLVDGVTKLSKFELQSADKRQVENFRKLLMATSRDIRVLLVKLADRLHNMRTLHFIKGSEKRARIARETMEIYTPLAERIGMHRIKDELEDLAFAELYPDARSTILARLDFLRSEAVETEVIDEISAELKRVLKEQGISVSLSGREKRPYSIWRKMQRQNVEFAQLSDIIAFRLVVEDVPQCYHALGVIHGQYSCVPGRFKDYISTPKRNGYKSIHTGVIGPQRRRIEIQIRTSEMHQVAELGVAAHWQYKQENPPRDADSYEYRWVRELLDILEHADDPDEFLEHTRLDLFQDQVFCFTPKGELIALPRGATPVDFAYEVHSEVGDACVGAKINGRLVQLQTKLRNGDQIEIVTSKPGVPSPDWEEFVVTGKARARIRRFVRSKQRTEYEQLGHAMLEKAFSKDGYQFSDQAIETVLPQLGISSAEDLYVSIGQSHVSATSVAELVVNGEGAETLKKILAEGDSGTPEHGVGEMTGGIPIRGLTPGVAVHYSNCCHPLPGDRIVGIQTPDKGIAVHTIDCETLESFHEMPERWVDISWDLGSTEDSTHIGRLNLVVANQRGGLANLATVVANNQGNIVNLKITNRTSELFEMLLDIEVHNNKHLNDIMAALRGVSVVSSVSRVIQ
ncbi:MAG: RelA/SpoT family protein [Alphaproteobacteria bacterium]|nr:RelA/SpoT family protein [Alphaproteobacteria bacterium]